MATRSWTSVNRLLTAGIGALLLGACQQSSPLHPLAGQGQTMRSLYQQFQTVPDRQQSHQLQRYRNRERSVPNLNQFAGIRAEPTTDFVRLPNPLLSIWVHPHFSGPVDGVPIPGYMTRVPMYRRDHFALATEVIR